MKYVNTEIGLMQAKDEMKRPEMLTVSCDTHETISIEIGSSCTLRLSEQEADELRRLLYDASNCAMTIRTKRLVAESTTGILTPTLEEQSADLPPGRAILRPIPELKV